MRPRPDVQGRTVSAAIMLLTFTFLVGLFQIAVLPPFEGFDETAHYAYIQQIALTGRRPHHGDPMSTVIDRYIAVGPTASSMHPAYGYSAFFGAADAVTAAGRAMIHEATDRPPEWQAGTTPNWEAQHPPLYYLLMAPAFLLTGSWSLGGQLFVLRALSYSLACAGLGLAIRAMVLLARFTGRPATPFVLAPALWPLLFPMWFPMMARLGNDSLVILVAGVVTLLALRILRTGSGVGSHIALGAALGLGLLTKATVLPLAVAVILVLALRAVKRPVDTRAGCWRGIALCCSALLVVAGWWYVGQSIETGSLIGSNDAVVLSNGSGWWAGLRAHGSPAAFLRDLVLSFGLSLIWAGTWSFVAPPAALMVPIFAMVLVLTWAGVVGLRTARLGDVDTLALLTLLLTSAGIVYQSSILFATIGSAAPAWYLHAFVPVLSPILGWAIAGASTWRISRWVLVAQTVYTPLFLLAATAIDLLLYTGCAPTPRESHHLDLAMTAGCLAHPTLIFDRLEIVAFPVVGGWLLCAALVALVLGMTMTWQALIAAAQAGNASTEGSHGDKCVDGVGRTRWRRW